MDTQRYNFHLLLHSADLVEGHLRRRLSKVGILPRQARIIDAMARMGAVSQVSLARTFDVTPASMSTMITRLIASGYISRENNPLEARSNILRLTTSGESLLVEIHNSWRDIDILIKDTIGGEQTELLTIASRKLRDQLGGKAPSNTN